MKRSYRLTSRSDYTRVRRTGKSYAHPLIVLVALRSDREGTRFGVSAGRTVGNAVQRNRAKRLIREAVRPLIESIEPGWDVVLLARKPVAGANFTDVAQAVVKVLQRARILRAADDDGRARS